MVGVIACRCWCLGEGGAGRTSARKSRTAAQRVYTSITDSSGLV